MSKYKDILNNIVFHVINNKKYKIKIYINTCIIMVTYSIFVYRSCTIYILYVYNRYIYTHTSIYIYMHIYYTHTYEYVIYTHI